MKISEPDGREKMERWFQIESSEIETNDAIGNLTLRQVLSMLRSDPPEPRSLKWEVPVPVREGLRLVPKDRA